MPWVKNGREEKFVPPPYTEPEVLGKDLPPSVRNDPKIQAQWQREYHALHLHPAHRRRVVRALHDLSAQALPAQRQMHEPDCRLS